MYKEGEIVRKLIEKIETRPSGEIQEIIELLEKLSEKIDLINQKLDKIIIEEIESQDLKDVHLKILNMLDGWMNTSDLAKILNFRHEYISRRVAELKKMRLVEEKRIGKSILYKRANQFS